MLTAVVFIIVLGVLILVHELGHFFTAKWLGVKVKEFGIGYPPTIWSINKNDTKYALNAIPLGGYVKLLGEDEEADGKDAFNNKKARVRLAVIVAGVVMNFVLAYFLLVIGYMIGMSPVALDPSELPGEKTNQVLIVAVDSGTPAENAGIKAGDFVNGFTTIDDFVAYTGSHRGETVTLSISRGGSQMDVPVTLRTDESVPALGAALGGQGTKVKLNIGQALVASGKEIGAFMVTIWEFLGRMISTLFGQGKLVEELSGPVGIYNITGQAVELGFVYILQLAAILSINLGVVNILPFPALDGGRALFILIEGIARKRIIKQEVEAVMHLVGFILLMLLIGVVTYREVVQLIIN